MYQELVAGIERFALPWAHLPHACKVVHLSLLNVGVLYVLHYFVEVSELLSAAVPHADARSRDFVLDQQRARVVMGGGVVEREVVVMMWVIGWTSAL